MMPIGARQDCVAGGADLQEKMSILKSLGYDFLELSLSRDEIAALNPGSGDKYSRLVESTGLPILSTSMGHFGGFAALGVVEQNEIVQHIRAMVRFTESIGADTVLLATREAQGDVAEYAEMYRNLLSGVADEAAAVGVTLALEHVGWYKPYQLAELVQAIDHESIRIYFDMGNCLYVGESPVAQARLCAPLTAQLHIKGGPTTPLGAMPLVEVRESLLGGGFEGRGCLEISGVEGERHLAEARGLLKMAGYLEA